MNNTHERNPTEESSMEDILSSIRQILASDEDAETSQNKTAVRTKPAPPREDVIELTEEISVLHTPIESKVAAQTVTSTQKEESLTMTTTAEQDAKLISQKAVEAASQALSKLSEALHPTPSAPISHTNVGGSVTLEALVTQAMQPILKEWMDKNLPQIIEHVVAIEIKKIVRQAT